MRYNGGGYCLSSSIASTLYIVPVLYVLQASHTPCQNSATAFVACLMSASAASASQGIPQTQEDVNAYATSECGDVPSVTPNITLVYSGLLWLSGYGIIPALIFGIGNVFMESISSESCCGTNQREQIEDTNEARNTISCYSSSSSPSSGPSSDCDMHSGTKNRTEEA